MKVMPQGPCARSGGVDCGKASDEMIGARRCEPTLYHMLMLRCGLLLLVSTSAVGSGEHARDALFAALPESSTAPSRLSEMCDRSWTVSGRELHGRGQVRSRCFAARQSSAHPGPKRGQRLGDQASWLASSVRLPGSADGWM